MPPRKNTTTRPADILVLKDGPGTRRTTNEEQNMEEGSKDKDNDSLHRRFGGEEVHMLSPPTMP